MTLFILISLAIVFSAIDSSIGIMYGTLLAPILVSLNYPTIDVTPSIFKYLVVYLDNQ